MRKVRADADAAWKNVLENFFKEAMEFCFFELYCKIDWSKGWDFLDKELQTITQGSAESKRFVDKLARVYLKNGTQEWLLLHVEVQGDPEEQFPLRMFVYNYRGYDKFQRHPFSCAILTDSSRNWRPNNYGFEFAGCKLRFEFPILKLRDLESRRAVLEQSSKPFDCIILIHINFLRSKKNSLDKKYQLKLSETKRLYRKGLSGEHIRLIFQFIDALISLPNDNELQLKNEIFEFERVNHMAYITSVERFGIEKGMLEEKRLVAMRCLQEQTDLHFISKITGLTLAQIQELRAGSVENPTL